MSPDQAAVIRDADIAIAAPYQSIQDFGAFKCLIATTDQLKAVDSEGQPVISQ